MPSTRLNETFLCECCTMTIDKEYLFIGSYLGRIIYIYIYIYIVWISYPNNVPMLNFDCFYWFWGCRNYDVNTNLEWKHWKKLYWFILAEEFNNLTKLRDRCFNYLKRMKRNNEILQKLQYRGLILFKNREKTNVKKDFNLYVMRNSMCFWRTTLVIS